MSKYKYTGKEAITIQGVGTVMPGDTVELHYEINHPLFTKTKETEKAKK